MGTGESLFDPEQVRRLQTALHAKAKEDPDFRFYSLSDKVWRADSLPPTQIGRLFFLSSSAQEDSEADQEQRKTAAKVGGVLLAAGLTLAVIDAKTEHRGITLASGACFVGLAAATLWEIKLKREQHSLAVGPRTVQFRLRW